MLVYLVSIFRFIIIRVDGLEDGAVLKNLDESFKGFEWMPLAIFAVLAILAGMIRGGYKMKDVFLLAG